MQRSGHSTHGMTMFVLVSNISIVVKQRNRDHLQTRRKLQLLSTYNNSRSAFSQIRKTSEAVAVEISLDLFRSFISGGRAWACLPQLQRSTQSGKRRDRQMISDSLSPPNIPRVELDGGNVRDRTQVG